VRSYVPSEFELTNLPTILTPDDVADLLRVDSRTLRRWVAARRFPEPIRLGTGKKGGRQPIRWHKKTLQKFLERMSKRTGRKHTFCS
jgi:hypothetical protein